MTGQPTRGTTVKITEQSDSKMVAQRSPYSQMAMGAVFIAGGVCVMVTAYRHSSIVAMLVCLALALFGVYEILTAKRVTLVADLLSATVSVAWRSLLGSGERSAGIADVDRITYREFTSTERTTRGPRTTRQDTSMLVLKDGTSFLLDKEQTSVRGWFQTLGNSSDEGVDRALSDLIGVPFVSNGITHTPLTAPSAALGSEQVQTQALTPPAPAAPPLASPAAPLTGPGSSPYWSSTPPPWARSK